MKRFASVILLVLILTGCTSKENNPAQISEVEKNTAITTSSAMRVTADETCSATTTEPTTTTTAKTDSCNYVEVSDGNEFIDFNYIENYKGITNQAEVEKATETAMKVLKDSSYYADTMKNIDQFDPDTLEGYLDNDGNIIPTFDQAFVDDFDGNGIKETFLLLDMPFYYGSIRNYLIFVNSNNEAEIFGDYSNIYELSILNYGKIKHLIIVSCGIMGCDARSSLIGIKNGKTIPYFDETGTEYTFIKKDCFLSYYGRMNSGAFMYFDTIALEYRVIVGEKLDIDEVLSMDKTGELESLKSNCERYEVYYVGNKYYCVCDCGLNDTFYTYTNGVFTPVDNYGIKLSLFYFNMNAVKNIDIDKAVAEMKKPEK